MRPLSLKGHDRPLTRVRINREGDLLFTSGKNKSPVVWYLENGERLGTYDGHVGVVWDIDITWDTQHMVSASGDNTMKVWDIETGTTVATRNLPTVVRSISYSYSGNLVAFSTTKIAMNPANFYVIDQRDPSHISGENPHHVLKSPLETQSDSCVFSHLDDQIIIGCNNGRVMKYDVRQGEEPVNFNNPHAYNITDLQMSSDQCFIISSSADKTAALHDAATLDKLKTYKSGRPVNSAAISPIRDHIVLGGGEEAMSVTQTAHGSGQFEAKLYHMVFEEEFANFKGHFGPINSIAFHPSGNIIVSGGEDGYVRVQELDKEYLEFDYDF
ncbi:eukaryotic initiation factor protein 3.I [Aphelenchoides avenae]|nr:eukaryotic initiation factor protein 3.I [Aphelenchus avenae]